MALTSDAYARMLWALLPPGRLWRAIGGELRKLLAGCAEELARLDARARDLLDEADPSTAVELLPEYEHEFELELEPVDPVRTDRGWTITKTSPNAHDGGASSVEALTGDGYVETTITGTTMTKAIGLSATDASPHWNTIQFGVLMDTTILTVRESGGLRYTGTCAVGDVLRVERTGSTIRYLQNGAVIYTSLVASSAPLHVDASIFNIIGQLSRIKLVAAGSPVPLTWQNVANVTVAEVHWTRAKTDAELVTERQARVVAREVAEQRYRPVDFQTALAPLLGLSPEDVVVLERKHADAVAMGDAREIFRFFVYRDPSLLGEYFLQSAQKLLDKIKPSHTAGHVIESIAFKCDDPFSLCDRDILGERAITALTGSVSWNDNPVPANTPAVFSVAIASLAASSAVTAMVRLDAGVTTSEPTTVNADGWTIGAWSPVGASQWAATISIASLAADTTSKIVFSTTPGSPGALVVSVEANNNDGGTASDSDSLTVVA